MAKKKTKKKAAKKKAPNEPLVVASKAKAYLKEKGDGFNVASDALDGLNSVVYWYLDQAAARAAENGRKTVRPHDFIVG